MPNDLCSEVFECGCLAGRMRGWVHHVDFDGETALLRYELCEQAHRDFGGHIRGRVGQDWEDDFSFLSR